MKFHLSFHKGKTHIIDKLHNSFASCFVHHVTYIYSRHIDKYDNVDNKELFFFLLRDEMRENAVYGNDFCIFMLLWKIKTDGVFERAKHK